MTGKETAATLQAITTGITKGGADLLEGLQPDVLHHFRITVIVSVEDGNADGHRLISSLSDDGELDADDAGKFVVTQLLGAARQVGEASGVSVHVFDKPIGGQG